MVTPKVNIGLTFVGTMQNSTTGNSFIHQASETQGREHTQKIHEKYKFPAFPHPESHKFLRPHSYLPF